MIRKRIFCFHEFIEAIPEPEASVFRLAIPNSGLAIAISGLAIDNSRPAIPDSGLAIGIAGLATAIAGLAIPDSGLAIRIAGLAIVNRDWLIASKTVF